MKKKLLSRAAAGALAGLAIGYAITILLSLGWGGGSYLPCRPELAALAGSESRAVALQALFALLVGAGFGACSLIWQIDRWSLARQTGVYFFLISLVMLPAAYGMYWMEHSLAGFAQYFGLFALFFLLFWGAGVLAGRRSVHKLNDALAAAQRRRPEG